MSKNFYQVSYLDMIVLKLLNDRDMYGYEIMDELSQRSQGVCDLKAGTLYPVLALLTEQELVVPYEKYTENHRIRKYYKITPKGTEALADRKRNCQDCCRMINCLVE